MKIIDGFKMRTVMGQSIIVGEGAKQVDFNKMISLNSSAALLWQSVEGKDFEVSDLADTLVKEYGIDRPTADADAKEMAESWIANGLVEA